VRAAQVCFTRAGVDRTTMDDVCAEAGLSKGAVYGHFTSKDELVIATMDLYAEGMEQLRAPDSLADLRRRIASYPDVPDDDLLRLEFEMLSRSYTDADVRRRVGENAKRLEASIEGAFKALVDAGKVKLRVPRKTAAKLVVTHMLGRMWWRAAARAGVVDASHDPLDALLELLVSAK
jgi:AcrR family transcriptional regulator